jgi:hypothetical protein
MSNLKQPCVSCGRAVKDNQQYPWAGHKKDCKLVNQWIEQYNADKTVVEVTHCEECPLAYGAFCNHPNNKKDYHIWENSDGTENNEEQQSPDWCPLRIKPTLIKLK